MYRMQVARWLPALALALALCAGPLLGGCGGDTADPCECDEDDPCDDDSTADDDATGDDDDTGDDDTGDDDATEDDDAGDDDTTGYTTWTGTREILVEVPEAGYVCSQSWTTTGIPLPTPCPDCTFAFEIYGSYDYYGSDCEGIEDNFLFDIGYRPIDDGYGYWTWGYQGGWYNAGLANFDGQLFVYLYSWYRTGNYYTYVYNWYGSATIQ